MAMRAALFDVDGTLVDTNHLHVTSWWEAFRQDGHKVSMSGIHHSIGLGAGELIARLLGDQRDRDQDAVISAAHTTLYATYFDRLPALEGAADLLRSLDDRGWRIVLASSAGEAELAAVRRALDADEVITAAVGSNGAVVGKPAPDPVYRALELAGASAERAVFVGDTVWDVEAATRAGVRAVALLSGGIPRTALESAGATAVYEDPTALLARLDTSVFAELDGR
ncbi:HAD family hydrolase [Streptomyces sp. NBC_00872]|uniref:HAD family hydrolase n=1 Tax=Streptomyces sp. NBC_00872 TaxID=2903686 RepID=UPI00386C2299|nr:HAD family hydrolase [Streptomyces sp. NBC_00872]